MHYLKLYFFFLTFQIYLLIYAYGSVISYNLVYTRVVGSPDNFNKTIILVNGKFPGPSIRGTAGDTMVVNVTNLLMESETLSVHYHGMSQVGTPWSDGTAGVTNCPLSYGQSYSYKFVLDKAGTYWYHTHVDARRIDGGYGFLIVDEPKESVIAKYDDELLIFISDWYHQESNYIEAGLLSFGPSVGAGVNPNTGFTWPGNGQAILVNGQGLKNVYLDVKPDKVYRVRIINSGALAYFNFAIAAHNLTVILVETCPVVPTSLYSLDIAVSQRFDFLLSTHNHTIGSYKIQLQTNWRGTDKTPAGIFKTVYLRYSGSNTILPYNPVNQTKPWNEQINQLLPINYPDPIPQKSDKTFHFNMGQLYVNVKTNEALNTVGTNTNGYLKWTVNETAYNLPSTPLLLASYYGSLNNGMPMPKYPEASKPYYVKLNEVIDIVIQDRVALNGNCETHPWHIHGNKFWVLGTGAGLYDPIVDGPKLNLKNPLHVDTVVNYATSNAQIRNIPASYPSLFRLWMFHCHIDWHLTLGMALVFDVSSEVLWKPITSGGLGLKLPSDYNTCGVLDSTIGTKENNPDIGTSSNTPTKSPKHINIKNKVVHNKKIKNNHISKFLINK